MRLVPFFTYFSSEISHKIKSKLQKEKKANFNNSLSDLNMMTNAKMNCSDSIASTCSSTSTRSVGSCLHNSMRSIDSSSNSTSSSRSSNNSVRFQDRATVRVYHRNRIRGRKGRSRGGQNMNCLRSRRNV